MYRLPSSPINRVDLTKNISRSSSAQPDGTQPIAIPALPKHLDELIDLPWSPEASRQIDLWLWYTQQEFEMPGGAV